MIEPVTLARSEMGEGPPVYLAHGLYGSSSNLGAVARGLADRFTAVSLDLRNHGASAWAAPMTYRAMADDLALAIEEDAAFPARIVGHSMGGKAVMALALNRPDLVERLAIVDIAPVRYRHDQRALLRAMRGLDPASIASRAEADRLLADTLPERDVRGFLLQNLVRGDGGRFRWRINLALIDQHMDDILGFPEELQGLSYDGPALAVSGALSPYVDDAGIAVLRIRFPALEHVRIERAGHLPHVEQPVAFVAALRDFLARSREAAGPGVGISRSAYR